MKCSNVCSQGLAYIQPFEFVLVYLTILFICKIPHLKEFLSTNNTSGPGQMKCGVESVKYSNLHNHQLAYVWAIEFALVGLKIQLLVKFVIYNSYYLQITPHAQVKSIC